MKTTTTKARYASTAASRPGFFATRVSIRVPRGRANWGTNNDNDKMEYYRDVMVEADGSVLAIDPVSDTYSRHHDLTETEMAQARMIAR